LRHHKLKNKTMPSYGEQQMPAGVDKSPAMKPLGKRTMRSKDSTIMPALTIDNCEYKGNAALRANQ
jgi:hypothetical protein